MLLFVSLVAHFIGTVWCSRPLAMKFNREWIKNGPVSPSQKISLTFAIQQKNTDMLEKALFDVSLPESINYGKHYTRQEVADLTSNLGGCEAVANWLAENDVKEFRETRYCEYVVATASSDKWSALLGAEFNEYIHDKKNVKMMRTERATIPDEIESSLFTIFDLVESESPTVEHSYIEKKQNLRQLQSKEDVNVYFLNSLYNITTNTGVPEASQCVYSSSGQKWSPNDLIAFQDKYNLIHQHPNQVDGENTTFCTFDTCGEANLDLQYIMGVSQVTTTHYWYANSMSYWISNIADLEHPPQVNSISYGAIETSYSDYMMNAFNIEAMKLGLQGVTVVVSTGDDGVSGYNCACDKDGGYVPQFPASSPYVTAVGATMGPETGDVESACQSDAGGVITTGGGFSQHFNQPGYQSQFVDNYFDVVSPKPKDGYNPTGRAYPDVSLIGVNYPVMIQGEIQKIYGTSASAPVFAAMISLINSARLQANMSALGFINPALYAAAANPSQNKLLYNDITKGKNNCCASYNANYQCCDAGFYAAEGWDPTTGLGSVDFYYLALFIGGVEISDVTEDDWYDDGTSSASILEKTKDVVTMTPVLISLLIIATCFITISMWFVGRCFYNKYFSKKDQEAQVFNVEDANVF